MNKICILRRAWYALLFGSLASLRWPLTPSVDCAQSGSRVQTQPSPMRQQPALAGAPAAHF